CRSQDRVRLRRRAKRKLRSAPVESQGLAPAAEFADMLVGSPRYPASTPLSHRRPGRDDLSKANDRGHSHPTLGPSSGQLLQRTLPGVVFSLGNKHWFRLSKDVAHLQRDERSDVRRPRDKNDPGSTPARGTSIA